MRDEIVDFIRKKQDQTGLAEYTILSDIGLSRRKFFNWRKAYGLPWNLAKNLPKSHHLENWEKERIIEFYTENEGDGYRRCSYMMMDKNIVYAAPSTVYSVLKRHDAIRSRTVKKSKKGTGFVQPLKAHEHWHSDITNVTVGDTVYFLISILDGYSRSIIAWELRKEMKAQDVAIVFQKAKEAYPNARPRCISDNGKQYKCKEFIRYIKENNYTQVTTSPYYPQSNGKQERWHGTIKSECIRIQCPINFDDANKIIGKYVEHYNEERLHSAIGYISPKDKLAGKEDEIWKHRDRKLTERRLARRSLSF